jgi:hypothetical protein
MAWLSKKISDLTGVEGRTEDFIEVTVRSAPGLKEPKKLDVLPSEIKDLKGAGELVILEIGTNGDRKQLIVTLAEWKKLSPKIDEIVKAAPGLRGRRPHQRPQQK